MEVTESALKSLLKSNENHNLFLLCGKELFLIKTYLEKIAEKYSADKSDAFNYTRFEGSPDAAAVVQVIDSLPVFAERRFVILNDLDIEKYDKKSADLLLESLSDLPDTTVVVLSYTGVKLDRRKAATKKLFSIIGKKGVSAEFDYLPPEKITGMIVKKAARENVVISKENARYIAELTLCDLTLIGGEVEKLCSFVGGGNEITKEIIDSLVTKQLATSVFALAGALVRKDIRGAFSILDELVDSGHDSTRILSTLSDAYLNLFNIKQGSAAGKNKAAIAADFRYAANRAWQIDRNWGTAGGMSMRYVKECLMILYNSDFLLKSSPANGKTVLEKTLAELSEAGVRR